MAKKKSPKRTPDKQWLSKKEHDVVSLIKAGHKNKAIADALNLSPKTVSTYVIRIYWKFGLDSTKNVYWLINKLESMDKLKR